MSMVEFSQNRLVSPSLKVSFFFFMVLGGYETAKSLNARLLM
jgi:hypothetical protein